MKRILFVWILAIVCCCSIYAQPILNVNEKEHNLGTILWNHPVTIEFKINNSGNSPLVMSNVTVSCACAIMDWTKAPITPGGTGMVKATFDAKALGSFHKTIGIYSNASKEPVYLAFTGKVSTEVDNSGLNFPYTIGKIGIDTRNIEFPDAYKGEIIEQEINIINRSDATYRPVLMHLPPYLKAEAQPETISKNKTGKIKLTLNTGMLKDLGLTNSTIYLSRFPGDIVGEENEISVYSVVVPDFSHWTEQQKMNPPSLQLSETNIDFGHFGTKDKLSHTITITNTGASQLEIKELQVFNSSVNASLRKRYIKPGASTKMKITLHKQSLKKGKASPRVLMITNDPAQPKVVITLKASNE